MSHRRAVRLPSRSETTAQPTRADRFLSHLTRRTTSGQFIPEIDGLRFVSIALVVLFHLSGYTLAKSIAPQVRGPVDGLFAQIAATGHYGVQLFFIISGFVLALPFARHYLDGAPAPRLRAYFLRRLTRLEPPYIIAMVSIFTIAALFFGASARQLWRHLVASLVYVHNLAYGTPSTVNVVAWSLEVEVQFYVLAPILAYAFAVRSVWGRRVLLLGGIAASILVQRIGVAGNARLSLTLLNYLQFFLLGFILADLYLTEWTAPARHESVWDAVGVIAWILLVTVWVRVTQPSLLFPVLAFVVFCAAFRGSIVRRILCNRWLTTIGGMCYTIYLLHYPLISAVARHTVGIDAGEGFALHVLVQATVILPLLLVVSIFFFVLVERPCMRKDWPQRLVAAIRPRKIAGAEQVGVSASIPYPIQKGGGTA